MAESTRSNPNGFHHLNLAWSYPAPFGASSNSTRLGPPSSANSASSAGPRRMANWGTRCAHGMQSVLSLKFQALRRILAGFESVKGTSHSLGFANAN